MISFWAVNSYSQVYPDSKVDSILRAGITSIVNQDYTGAEFCFKKLDDEYPHLPLGKIYLSANKIAQAYDYAEEFDDDFISSNLEEAKKQAEELLNANGEKLWFLYFFALAEGYIAYFDALNGNWLSAVSTGMSSISVFEQCKMIDENFYEANIAVGTYEYWHSRKTEFLHWLPFIDDNSAFGIEQLKTAIDSSSYNTYLAINSLIWIYIDQQDYEAAVGVSKSALKKFPGSRLFKWGMARAYEESDPFKSIKIYTEILNSYPKRYEMNHFNEVILKHLIAQQYQKMGDFVTAKKLCEQILQLNLSEFEQDKLKERLHRIENLNRELTQIR